MSADDWIECPFCAKSFNERIEVLRLKLKEEYERMPAKEYDHFKSSTESAIREIEGQKDEVSSARVDGISNFWFDEQGNFEMGISAYCPNCNRQWQIEGKAEPTIYKERSLFG